MNLALFFTFDMSIEQWRRQGLFDREKLLYEELLRRGSLSKVFWITYGSGDWSIADELRRSGRLNSDIEVLPMPAFFNFPSGKYIYSLLMPVIYKKVLRQADVFMTNQMSGSWAAVLAKKISRKPLIVRTGYTWSRLKQSQKTSVIKKWFICAVERLAYRNADLAVVTTPSQAEYVKSNYDISECKIFVAANYIDTDLFRPAQFAEKFSDKVLFVGRINEEKNLFNLTSAVAKAQLCLDIYGSGSVMGLSEHISKVGAKVLFKGVVENHRLPDIYNQYKYFVLPSYAESLPKSLLEAMACGLVCIGTNVTGINEVIIDGVNGYLAEDINSDSIFQAIQRAKEDSGNSLTDSAIETIRTGYSLEGVVKKYAEILGRLCDVR